MEMLFSNISRIFKKIRKIEYDFQAPLEFSCSMLTKVLAYLSLACSALSRDILLYIFTKTKNRNQ